MRDGGDLRRGLSGTGEVLTRCGGAGERTAGSRAERRKRHGGLKYDR